MERNFSDEAIILSVSPAGEHNRCACVFSGRSGIFYAVLYGGPKSKLRSLVSPWNRGKLFLYRDKKYVKITDFDVRNFHPSFRENLFKSWAASLAAELLIKTKCAGSPAETWMLLNGFLDGLELCDEKNGRLGLIRFLWRYIGLLGVRPDASHCVRCGASFFTGTSADNEVLYTGTRIVFNAAENGFLCSSCACGKDEDSLSIEAVRYLAATAEMTPREARIRQIDHSSENEIKQLVFLLTEAAAGTKLKSLESGIGIL